MRSKVLIPTPNLQLTVNDEESSFSSLGRSDTRSGLGAIVNARPMVFFLCRFISLEPKRGEMAYHAFFVLQSCWFGFIIFSPTNSGPLASLLPLPRFLRVGFNDTKETNKREGFHHHRQSFVFVEERDRSLVLQPPLDHIRVDYFGNDESLRLRQYQFHIMSNAGGQ